MNEPPEPAPWTYRLIAGGGALAFAASLGYFLYSYGGRFGRLAGREARERTDADVRESARPVVADVALFSAFALHHSALARPRLKAAVIRVVPPALERPLYVWTASLLFLGVCRFWRPVPGVLYRARSVWALPGYAVQLGGLLLTVLGARRVDVRHLAGVGEPFRDSDPGPPALETGGVYGLVRHPLYLGWALFVFGAPAMTATRATFALVSTTYLVLAIPWEERGLATAFGAAYERYRQRVRWRMLPGLW